MSYSKYQPYRTAARDVSQGPWYQKPTFTGGWSRLATRAQPNSWQSASDSVGQSFLGGRTASRVARDVHRNATLGSRLERRSAFINKNLSRADSVYGGRSLSQAGSVYGGRYESQGDGVYGGRYESQGDGVYGGRYESQGDDVYGGRSLSRAGSVYGGRYESRAGSVYGGGRVANEGYCTCPCESEKRGGCSKDQRVKAIGLSNEWHKKKEEISVSGKGAKGREERKTKLEEAWENFRKAKKLDKINSQKDFEQGIAGIIYCDNKKDANHDIEEGDVIFGEEKRKRYPDYGTSRARLANDVKKYI